MSMAVNIFRSYEVLIFNRNGAYQDIGARVLASSSWLCQMMYLSLQLHKLL